MIALIIQNKPVKEVENNKKVKEHHDLHPK